MPYKYIDFKSLEATQAKIEEAIIKLTPMIAQTTNPDHVNKLKQTKAQLETKLKDLIKSYANLCTLARSQNQTSIELIEKNHEIAKGQIEKAIKDVEDVEAGEKDADGVLKGFDMYEKYIQVLLKQVEKDAGDLIAALSEFRGSGWLMALRRIDDATADKWMHFRQESITENTNAKGLEKRMKEYLERLGVLRKRLEKAKAGKSNMTDLAEEVDKLHERIKTDTSELNVKLQETATHLREDAYMIRRCKDHAAAEKALPKYASKIIPRVDKLTALIKQVKGKLKTMSLEKDGMAVRVKDSKPLLAFIKAIEKLLQDTYDKAEEFEKEAIASRKMVDTLSDKK